jgi:hypothetical protein
MRAKNNTRGAMGEALRKVHLKLQTSQIENIPQRSNNATIEGTWGGLKAGPAVEQMAESLRALSRQPWQERPQPTERPKRKHRRHRQPKRSRVRAILRQIFPSGIPPESELSNKELLRRVDGQLKKPELKNTLYVHDRTILRAARRSK